MERDSHHQQEAWLASLWRARWSLLAVRRMRRCTWGAEKSCQGGRSCCGHTGPCRRCLQHHARTCKDPRFWGSKLGCRPLWADGAKETGTGGGLPRWEGAGTVTWVPAFRGLLCGLTPGPLPCAQELGGAEGTELLLPGAGRCYNGLTGLGDGSRGQGGDAGSAVGRRNGRL